jgi:hypothetical protein
MYIRKAIILCLLGICISNYVCSFENIWLSGDPPPQARHKVRPSGMQHFMAYRNKRGQEKLILWPRSGQTPKESVYLNSFTLEPSVFVVSPEGDLLDYELIRDEKGFALSYDFKLEGYHNIYFLWKEVENDTLFVHVAKAERLSHKCQNGHRNLSRKVKVKSFPEFVPFEIIRNRFKPTEDFHFILKSGDIPGFSALLNNKKVVGASFCFVTEKAWAKTLTASENAEVHFQIPEDYFTSMKELNKDNISHFLLTSKFDKEEIGTYKGKSFKHIHYTCTYAGDYEPSPSLYKSSFWPIIIILFSSLAIGSFIYWHRRKKSYYY